MKKTNKIIGIALGWCIAASMFTFGLLADIYAIDSLGLIPGLLVASTGTTTLIIGGILLGKWHETRENYPLG